MKVYVVTYSDSSDEVCEIVMGQMQQKGGPSPLTIRPRVPARSTIGVGKGGDFRDTSAGIGARRKDARAKAYRSR